MEKCTLFRNKIIPFFYNSVILNCITEKSKSWKEYDTIFASYKWLLEAIISDVPKTLRQDWRMDQQKAYNNYRLPVPVEFDEVFSHFYFAENSSEEPVTRMLLPSFQTIMVFSFGTPVSFITKQNEMVEISKCLVMGPIKQSFHYTIPPGGSILVANFRDDAFFRFFGTASSAAKLHADPDDLAGTNCFTALWSELNNIQSIEKKVDHILEYCKPFLRSRTPIASQIISLEETGISPVKEISDKENISERSVQMNLKKQFGYSSREIGRYLRFLKALRMVQQLASSNSAEPDWFEIIDACGYYDQSQLIHDFKHYTDLSPSKYLKFQQGICTSRG